VNFFWWQNFIVCFEPDSGTYLWGWPVGVKRLVLSYIGLPHVLFNFFCFIESVGFLITEFVRSSEGRAGAKVPNTLQVWLAVFS